MANPNTAMRYLAKQPYERVVGYDSMSSTEAEAVAEALRKDGWQVKVTTTALWRWEHTASGGRRKNYAGVEYSVWKRAALGDDRGNGDE